MVTRLVRGSRSRRLVAPLLLATLGVSATAAWSYWTGVDEPLKGPAVAVAATVSVGAVPAAASAGATSVALSWDASTLSNDLAVDGYIVKRYEASSTDEQSVGPGCSGTVATSNCTETGMPAGTWRYTVTPVFSSNWRGGESEKSDDVIMGSTTLTLAKTLFAGPLPTTTTGSVTGFSPNEPISYTLDGASIAGSPTSVDASGNAAITAITIPDVAGGPHTVRVTGASSGFVASTGILVDTVVPSGGSVSYPSAYVTADVVIVTFSAGTDTGGSGLNSASGLLQRSAATLINGVCGTFGGFTTVATNPASPTADPVVSGCYQYRYLISDNVGNQATYTSATIAKVDRESPTNTTILSTATGAFAASGTATIYFKSDAAGSFKLVNTVIDAASGPASTTFPAVATTGWVHNAETLSTPTGGPYTSSTYSWSAGASVPGPQDLIGTDAAGLTLSKTISFTSDITGPASGGITYAAAVFNATSVPISLATGSDAGSGVNPDTTLVKRDVATLTTLTETCGTFPGTYATTVTLVGGADTSVSSGNAYKYNYIVSDKLGNVTTYTNTNVAKVDTNGPRVTAIASQQSGGTAGNGLLQIGDKLILTFNQNLATASVPTSFSGATESSPVLAPGTLNIPGITAGTVQTGNSLYVLLSLTFGGTISLSNNGTATTVTLIVTSLSGLPLASSGTLSFVPAATIQDSGGNPAAGTFTTASAFKLF